METSRTTRPIEPAAPTGRAARRTLVSGGAGFIGSHLAEFLLARGDHVTVIDNLSTGRRSNLNRAEAAAGERLRFIEADLSRALDDLGPGEPFDEIYHLAAAVGVQRVMEHPIESIETNIHECAAALRFAHERRAPILIASSSEVYGKPAKDLFSEEDDVVYGPTTVTRWSYACSKAIDEFLALAYAGRRGLHAVVVRLFNTVGPRQVGDYGMVVPRFVEAAIRGNDLQVHGDGGQSRCFCDVRDVAGALPALLAKSDCAGRIFNIGSDRPITILELAELVVRTLGSSSRIRRIPYAEAFGPAAQGFEDLRRRRPDLARIRAAINFEPSIPLEQTIRDVAAFLREKGAGP